MSPLGLSSTEARAGGLSDSSSLELADKEKSQRSKANSTECLLWTRHSSLQKDPCNIGNYWKRKQEPGSQVRVEHGAESDSRPQTGPVTFP